MPIARWVCIVCCRSLSENPGVCRRCNVDRLDLDRKEVRDELAQRIDALLEKKRSNTRAWMGGIALFFGINAAIASMVFFGDRALELVNDLRAPILMMAAVGGGVGGGLFWLLRLIYVRARPRSAEAILSTREARGGDNALRLRTHGTAASRLDPAHADHTDVLLAFGATFDD